MVVFRRVRESMKVYRLSLMSGLLPLREPMRVGPKLATSRRSSEVPAFSLIPGKQQGHHRIQHGQVEVSVTLEKKAHIELVRTSFVPLEVILLREALREALLWIDESADDVA